NESTALEKESALAIRHRTCCAWPVLSVIIHKLEYLILNHLFRLAVLRESAMRLRVFESLRPFSSSGAVKTELCSSNVVANWPLGHLNRSINLMINPVLSDWTGPLEAISMRNDDCESNSIAKYAAARVAGIPPDRIRLVIVHNRRHNEDHMVAA